MAVYIIALRTNMILQVEASKLVRRLYVGSVLESDRMAVTLIPRTQHDGQTGIRWLNLTGLSRVIHD